MIQRIEPTDYYDEPYGPGTHVVLLYRHDDLYRDAISAFERVGQHVRFAHFWTCRIDNVADAETIQAVRFPQYRVMHDGSERLQHTGVLLDAELVDLLDNLET